MDNQLAQHIQELEETLLRQDVRKSPEMISQLLADEFVEFGSSGLVYDKAQVVAHLPAESTELQISAEDFVVKQLAPAVVLVTYLSVKREAGSEVRALRSSIWQQFDGEWKMIFHQGTKVT